MLLLMTGFVVVLLVSFGLVLYVTMPTKDDQRIEQRVASLQASGSSGGAISLAASEFMKTGPAPESPWAELIARRSNLARKLRLLIEQSDVRTSLTKVILTSAALALAAAVVAYVSMPMLIVDGVIALVFGSLPILYLMRKKSSRLKAFDAELSNCIDMMSNALRAGHSVVGAIGILAEQAVEPAGTEFREVFAQQNFGIPLREALLELLERVPSADLRVVVTGILVQRDTGGNLGEILDRTVFVIRERVRIQGEIRVQTAQGRITGYVLTCLPIFMLLAINIVNPGYSAVLLKDPFGQKLIYIGIVLLAVGAFSIRRIMSKIEV